MVLYTSTTAIDSTDSTLSRRTAGRRALIEGRRQPLDKPEAKQLQDALDERRRRSTVLVGPACAQEATDERAQPQSRDGAAVTLRL